MGREYRPDSWQIVKVTAKEGGKVHYRVMCTWDGGYIQGESWKLSSGILSIKDNGRYWEVENASGSVYFLLKTGRRWSGYGFNVFDSLCKDAEHVTFEVIDIGEVNV